MDHDLKILIADDHPIFRRGLGDVIGQDSSLHLVGEAGNGAEAWKMISEYHPDIAVLDIHMPEMTGLQVARKLIESQSDTKAILLTMHEDEDTLNEALNLGIKGYVLKEDAVDDLLRCIRSVSNDQEFISASLSSLLLHRRHQANNLRQQKPEVDSLTPMERQVLKLIANDKTSKEIAEILGKAVRTVDTHRQNISLKLGLKGSHSLLKFAFKNKASL